MATKQAHLALFLFLFLFFFSCLALSLLADSSENMDLAGDGGLIDSEEGEEMTMDSESSRRMLYRRLGKYVSYYSIIEMDSVPCDRRGHSYYSCMYRGPVRPYMRGCSRFTKCRSRFRR
ncbi:rapid alkalinization factor-like [Ipomoea triloba]|uniref:rapid alkalinization factor-like n=1 Tax=Ipomoea triloba TaxID=35885 RepID=UPI00125DF87C|nr:rapid alkalinization factor-like [Ipomoea triloba]